MAKIWYNIYEVIKMKKRISFLLAAICLISTLAIGSGNIGIVPLGGPGVTEPMV
jgi:hypothetical protein